MSVCLCVYLTICLSAPVCMSQRLSVCPLVCLFYVKCKKTSKYYLEIPHSLWGWDTEQAQPHDSKIAFKVKQSVFYFFSSAKWILNFMYKITINFTEELEANTPPPHTHNGGNKE